MKKRNASTFSFRRTLVSTCLAALCTIANAQTFQFDIAGGTLKQALDAYAEQSGAQLVYKQADVKGLVTKGLKRSLSAEDALKHLLEGTPLGFRRDDTGAVVLFTETSKQAEVGEAAETQQVTVSATRRNEPLREVPMQVNVLHPATIRDSGAKSLSDYMGNQPGVDVRSAGGPGISDLSIRGVTTGQQTIATVGVYVDDVPVGSSTAFASGASMALDMALLDLNNIELLRGPQGTLYGAGAMGGVLKYVTSEPESDEFTGSATLSMSGTRQRSTSVTASAVVNVPLKQDFAALRVSAFQDHDGGSVKSIGPAPRSPSNDGDTTGVRASLLVEPSSKLKLRATFTQQKLARNGYDYVDYDINTGKPINGPRSRFLTIPEAYRVNLDLYSAEAEYDFGWARLNAVTSVQSIQSPTVSDASSIAPFLNSNFGAALNFDLASIAQVVNTSVKKQTQEVRLTSKADNQFEWLAGVFYDEEQASQHQGLPGTNTDGTAGPNLLTADVPTKYRESAAFGDATWKFSNGLAVTGGLRVARNRQTYTQTSSGLLLGGDASFESGSAETAKTYLLTGRYSITSTTSVYARLATGYRPGGPNPIVHDPSTGASLGLDTFGHDTLTSSEVGYKGEFIDKKLSIESAIYNINWRNLQQNFAVNGVNVIVNAGKARVRGAEFSATYREDEHWSVNGGLSLLDAKLTEDAPGLGASGARLPNSARVSFDAGGTYSFGLFDRKAYVGFNERYVGNRNAGFDKSGTAPNYRMPSYELTDLRGGIAFGNFNVNVFARNIFDRKAQLAATTANIPLGSPLWVSLSPGRTIGTTVTVAF